MFHMLHTFLSLTVLNFSQKILLAVLHKNSPYSNCLAQTVYLLHKIPCCPAQKVYLLHKNSARSSAQIPTVQHKNHCCLGAIRAFERCCSTLTQQQATTGCADNMLVGGGWWTGTMGSCSVGARWAAGRAYSVLAGGGWWMGTMVSHARERERERERGEREREREREERERERERAATLLYIADANQGWVYHRWFCGFVGDPFHLSRSVRQGCSLASYLFLFFAEALSSSLRSQVPRLRGL